MTGIHRCHLVLEVELQEAIAKGCYPTSFLSPAFYKKLEDLILPMIAVPVHAL